VPSIQRVCCLHTALPALGHINQCQPTLGSEHVPQLAPSTTSAYWNQCAVTEFEVPSIQRVCCLHTALPALGHINQCQPTLGSEHVPQLAPSTTSAYWNQCAGTEFVVPSIQRVCCLHTALPTLGHVNQCQPKLGSEHVPQLVSSTTSTCWK
jgi:hypothetical protein